jgi:integrase/recombinase XerD
MTELRQRMLDAMVQRGFAVRTQDSYVRAIRRMACYFRRDPALYTPQDVQAYLLHMVKEEHLSYSSMNQAACAAQFLYQVVLGHGREQFQVPIAKVPAKQPELLGREEIARLLAACTYPARRMLLQTVYASGLRVSEACALQVGDIDSAPDRMCIRVAHRDILQCPCCKAGALHVVALQPGCKRLPAPGEALVPAVRARGPP